MPFFPTSSVRLQPYFGYRNRERLRLTARALRSKADKFESKGRWQAMRTMLAQFASHEVADLPVELEIVSPAGTKTRHRTITDGDGYARFDIPLTGDWPYDPRPEWETVTLHWLSGGDARSVDAHVLSPGEETALGVISDIDDTIIETGITGNFRAVLRNWRRVLMEMPEERILVPGTDVFYSALGGGDVQGNREGHAGEHRRASNRPFFYVSSSPWNLFSYLVAYMRGRGIPLGPIMLRDWGLNRETFGSSSHGAHKTAAITDILATYPEIRFALIGDDSQGDLTAFADIASAHGARIAAIFIRKVGEAMSPEERAGKEAIEAANVPLWLGEGYTEIRAFLTSIGLLGDGEAAKIMASVEERGTADVSVPVQGEPG